ncbi:hypothetical protein Bca101_016764 [Brassica carinata]
MKTVTGSVNNAKPISLAKAATLLSGFVSSETQASQDVSAYLRRASAAFTELRSFHREIRSANPNPNSEARHPKEELSRAKGIDDLVEKETVTGEESVHGRKQDEKKKEKRKENKEEDFVEEKVMVKLEDEQRNKERKKKNKDENVFDEKVNVKLEKERKEKKNRKSDGEIGSEERKSKKKRKSKEIDA